MGIMSVGFTAAATTAYAFIAAVRSMISAGFDYAAQMELSKAGLSALSLAIQDKNIPLTIRMNEATKESIVVMKALQEINANTPHTLDQTNQIYKAMYVSMKNVGASSQEIIDVTQRLSVASGAAGIEFNSLLAGVDGLASGTVMANSDLGRFLGSLGLTNEALKSSTDVVKLLNETLADFKAIDTITTATSNLANEWGKLSDSVTQDIFLGAKDGMNEMSKLMKTMSDEDTRKLRESFNVLAIAMSTALLGITKGVVFLMDGFESLGARIAGVTFRLENGLILNDAESEALDRMYQSTKDNIQARADFMAKLEASIDVMTSSIKSSEKQTKANISEAESYEILNSKVDDSMNIGRQATDAEMEKIYTDELAAMGLNALGDEIDGVSSSLDSSIDSYKSATEAANGYTDSIITLANASQQQGQLAGNGARSQQVVAAGSWESSQSYREFSNLQSGIMPFMSGFASGGYTGNTGTNDVAGVVHGKEYVVNAKTTQDLGLNGKGGLFESMDSKMEMLKALPDMVASMNKMLYVQKQQYAILAAM